MSKTFGELFSSGELVVFHSLAYYYHLSNQHKLGNLVYKGVTGSIFTCPDEGHNALIADDPYNIDWNEVVSYVSN